jgi:hypothetical protein
MRSPAIIRMALPGFSRHSCNLDERARGERAHENERDNLYITNHIVQ